MTRAARPTFGREAGRLLRAIAVRAEAARRLDGDGSAGVLRSVVEATVALFEAEAASIALYDPVADRLVFEVAAGERGQPVVGLSIAPEEGIAGYVFRSGQALALSDVEHDPRFGRSVAERTAYVPRSIIAAPLVDDQGTIGVLEILDKRRESAFSLRDVELAGVFARQASVAIRASRVERDVTVLLRTALRDLAGAPTAQDDAAIEALVARATATLGRDDDTGLWRLVEQVARIRTAEPRQVELVSELLEVLVRRADATGRARQRARPAATAHDVPA